MRDRPIYVSLICIFLVVFHSWYLIHAFAFINGPTMKGQIAAVALPPPLLVTKHFAKFFIPVLCGMFMWEGANWARVLYIGWGIVNYTLDSVYFPPERINVYMQVAFGVFALFLLLPGARGYFLLPRHHS